MRWTRMALLTRALEADGEVVWFRHPKGWCQVRAHARATVARVQGSPRRARISLKPSRRESRMPPLHLYARVPPTSTPSHTRPRVQRAPGFPCALSIGGRTENSSKPRANRAARSRRCVYARHRCNRMVHSRNIGADIHHPDGYINPARHVRAFGVRMGIINDGIDTIERRPG